MTMLVSARFDPTTPDGRAAINLVVALAAVGDSPAITEPPTDKGLPDAFLDAVEETSPAPMVLVHVGSAADQPPAAEGCRARVVWHHPTFADDAPTDPGWDAVIAPNPERRVRDAVVAYGVDLDGFALRRRTRPLGNVLVVGDLHHGEQIGAALYARHPHLDGTMVNVIDPTTASRPLRRQLWPQADIAVVADQAGWEAAVELAATGAYLIGPDVGDLAGIIRTDWATPVGPVPDDAADAVADAVHNRQTPHRATLGAQYVGTAYNWERVAGLLSQHVRRLL